GLTDSEEETATSQVMISRDTDSGQWLLWYRNRKSFSVTLELLVPVRVVGDQRQLLLTLPVASRTELQLQIDQQNLMVDLQSRGFWEKEQNENGTLIRIAGFQQNVDLNWSQER